MLEPANTGSLRFPPLPVALPAIRALYEANSEMLELWRERKNVYVSGYVMLGRWGQNPGVPALQEWMVRLTYNPIGDAPDERLADPRGFFPVSMKVKPFLPPTELWHRFEKLGLIRHNAITHNFDPQTVALNAQDAVLELISLAEALCDRLLESMEATALQSFKQDSVSSELSVPKSLQASRQKLFPKWVPENQNLVDCIVMLDSERDPDTADMEILLKFFCNDERKAKLMQDEIKRARHEGTTSLPINTKRYRKLKGP